MEKYCRILILDDEFIMRQGMKHMLDWEKEGFQIVGEGASGEEGLALVEELHPHIVLADIVMPVMDGIEFSAILGRKHPEIQLIILSSYDKFEYVKTTLLNGASDYILKPMLNSESLLKTLRKAAERIPGLELKGNGGISCAGQLERFLMGFTDHLDEAAFADVFPNTLYRLFAVNLRNCCDGMKKEFFSVRQRLEEFFADKKEYSIVETFLQEEILCIVMNYRVKDDAAALKDMDEIAGKIRRLYPNAFFVLSRSFTSMQDIRCYYKQDIVPETEKGFYYPEKYLYVSEAYHRRGEIKRFDYENYAGYLASKEYGKALDLFEAYTEYLCTHQIEEERLKNLTKNLLYNYLVEIEKLSGQNDSAREKYFHEIAMARRVDRFREVTASIFADLREILDEKQGSEDQRIREIKNYIDAHYQEPLELQGIAERFGLSYSYLSTYFSQTAKEGFTEYLNKIRIRHAKELLEQKGLPISRVGSMAGYTEHSYFCRVFKKLTAETPSEYRRRVKQA